VNPLTIATKVLEKLIDEAKTIGVSYIDLSATADGLFLYEKMGFKKSEYITMNLQLV